MGIEFQPDRFYTEYELRQGGFFTEASLSRARKNGLRCKTTGHGRRVYLGQWLLDWLGKADPVKGAAP